MQITFRKLLGLAIAVVYAEFAYLHAGGAGLKWSLGLLLPLVLIWLPDEIGSCTGYFKTGYVNAQTPGVIIEIAGWCLLLGLPLAAWLVSRAL